MLRVAARRVVAAMADMGCRIREVQSEPEMGRYSMGQYMAVLLQQHAIAGRLALAKPRPAAGACNARRRPILQEF